MNWPGCQTCLENSVSLTAWDSTSPSSAKESAAHGERRALNTRGGRKASCSIQPLSATEANKEVESEVVLEPQARVRANDNST